MIVSNALIKRKHKHFIENDFLRTEVNCFCSIHCYRIKFIFSWIIFGIFLIIKESDNKNRLNPINNLFRSLLFTVIVVKTCKKNYCYKYTDCLRNKVVCQPLITEILQLNPQNRGSFNAKMFIKIFLYRKKGTYTLMTFVSSYLYLQFVGLFLLKKLVPYFFFALKCLVFYFEIEFFFNIWL